MAHTDCKAATKSYFNRNGHKYDQHQQFGHILLIILSQFHIRKNSIDLTEILI